MSNICSSSPSRDECIVIISIGQSVAFTRHTWSFYRCVVIALEAGSAMLEFPLVAYLLNQGIHLRVLERRPTSTSAASGNASISKASINSRQHSGSCGEDLGLVICSHV